MMNPKEVLAVIREALPEARNGELLGVMFDADFLTEKDLDVKLAADGTESNGRDEAAILAAIEFVLETGVSTTEIISTVVAALSPDEAEVVADEAEVVADEAEVVADEAEAVPAEAEVVPDEAEVVAAEAEAVPDEAEVVPAEAEAAEAVVAIPKVVPFWKKWTSLFLQRKPAFDDVAMSGGVASEDIPPSPHTPNAAPRASSKLSEWLKKDGLNVLYAFLITICIFGLIWWGISAASKPSKPKPPAATAPTVIADCSYSFATLDVNGKDTALRYNGLVGQGCNIFPPFDPKAVCTYDTDSVMRCKLPTGVLVIDFTKNVEWKNYGVEQLLPVAVIATAK